MPYYIVYTLTSDEHDTFLAQMYVSSYSVKLHNPNIKIKLVCDQITHMTFDGTRKKALKYVDEIIKVNVPIELTKKQRSRWIKTSLREHISGDYLAIDTDTIVCEPLGDINKPTDIMAVLDVHIPLNENIDYFSILEKGKNIGWDVDENDKYYFNSGVIFVRDNSITHEFYRHWHNNWNESVKKGFDFDQPSFAFTNKQMGFLIEQLPGEWNCQILINGLPYLGYAKIIHYFNICNNINVENNAYYFSNPSVFLQLVENDYNLTSNTISRIKQAKTQIQLPCEILNGQIYKFVKSEFGRTMLEHYTTNSHFYRILIFTTKLYNILLKYKSRCILRFL